MITNFDIYQLLLENKKLTRSNLRQKTGNTQEEVQEESDGGGSKNKQKLQKLKTKKTKISLQQFEQGSQDDDEQIVNNDFEDNKSKNQSYSSYLRGQKKLSEGLFIQCQDCQQWIHKEDDEIFMKDKPLFKKYLANDNLYYRCSGCRLKLKIQIYSNIIRFLTYFDSDKLLWLLDQNQAKYFEVIHHPIDFVTIYMKNRDKKYIEDPESTFFTDVKLMVSNLLEYNPSNTKAHRMGLHLRVIYELILKRMKPLLKISEFELVYYDISIFPYLIQEITSEMASNFLNCAFGQKDLVTIKGSQNYKPLWEAQLLSFSPQVQLENQKNILIQWEKEINENNKQCIQYECEDEVLIKLNFQDFCRHQIQQDTKILINFNKIIQNRENQYIHPYLEYLFKLPQVPFSDESNNKLELQTLITKLLTKDISKISITQSIGLKVQPKQILEYICNACGGYEYLDNLQICCQCKQTYHFYCQIQNAHLLPSRVFHMIKQGSQWKCNQCITCQICNEIGGRGDLFCCVCNKFYHFKCTMINFLTVHEQVDFWKCPNCFICKCCGSNQLFDSEKLSKMKPSTTSNTLHISIEYFQNFTLCLSCGLEQVIYRFCDFCQEYIQMNIQEELVDPLIPHEIGQIESQLVNFYFDQFSQGMPRRYLSKDYKESKPSKKCIKCSSMFHLSCLEKANKRMSESSICFDCNQDMSQLIHKFEKLKHQYILQQIQAKTIKKIVPIISSFLEFNNNITSNQQTFILENLEQLDHLVNAYLRSSLGIEDLKQELTGSRNTKDEYIEKLQQYWCCRFDCYELPKSIFSTSLQKRQEWFINELDNDYFERVVTINLFKQKKHYLILSPQVLLSQQQLLDNLDIVCKLGYDSSSLLSSLQCIFVKNLQIFNGFSFVNDQYYVDYLYVLNKFQKQFKYQWNLNEQQQIIFLPYPNSIIRSIKKIIGTQMLESKKLQYKDSLLVQKGWIKITPQQLKQNIRQLSERLTDQQINEKFRTLIIHQKTIKQSFKEIQQLYNIKIQEIQLRPQTIEQEQPIQITNDEIPIVKQIMSYQIQEDKLLHSPLNDQKCEFCKINGNRTISGRLLYVDSIRWVHVNCVLWNEDCKEVELCVKNLLNSNTCHCEYCGQIGATISCYKCRKRMHFYCAYRQKWEFLMNKKVICINCTEKQDECVTEFFQFKKIGVQQKQDRQQTKSMLRFGNTILIQLIQGDQKQVFEQISILTLRHEVLYLSLNLKQNTLKISKVDQNKLIQEYKKDQKIFQQVVQLILEQNPSTTYQLESLDELYKSLIDFNILNIQNEDYFGQFFLLFTQYVRQNLLDKSQPKSVNVQQFTSFKQWFYLDIFIEDLPIGVRTQQISYLSRIIQNDTSSYNNHPMLFDAQPKNEVIQNQSNSKLSRKESYLQIYIQPNEILEEAGMLSEEVRVIDQQEELEKRLRLEYQKNKRPRLYVAPSLIHKYGLFTKQAIKRGELVIEYTGEVIRNALADYREIAYNEQGFGDCYMFRASQNTVIDATFKGSEARFLNHSCSPNCSSLLLDEKILIYAKKNIAPCEELTYDYQFEIEAESQKIQCHCGAKNCIGRLN